MNNGQKLSGKVALVTGGSRGIGAAIAKRLGADGARVAITYTKGGDAAASVIKEIERAGGKAIAIQADAADAGAVRTAVEKTVTTFGRLDILVNNAGTAIPKPFEEATLEEMNHVIDINLRGVFAATQAALKHLPEGGRIITIGSAVGERVLTPGLVPYAATTDQHLVRFLNFDADALLKELAAGKGDGEILQWVLANAKTPRTPWEIETWSAFMEKRGPDSDAETLALFAQYVGQHSKIREDIKTWFEAIELDDYASFGGKA